jgi:hypothetical protein
MRGARQGSGDKGANKVGKSLGKGCEILGEGVKGERREQSELATFLRGEWNF